MGAAEFTESTKKMTIGEKREIKAVDTVGPGDYSPEKADFMIKVQSVGVDFAKKS